MRARRAPDVSDQLLPDQRDLLEVGHLAPRIRRGVHGLRVEIDQRSRLVIGGLRGRGGEQPGERVERLRRARRRDPGCAQVLDRLVAAVQGRLGDLRRVRERLRALGLALDALGFGDPELDALLVVLGDGQEPIQGLEHDRVFGVDLERGAGVLDGRIERAEPLVDAGQRSVLVGEDQRVHQELQARPSGLRRHGPVAHPLVEPDQLVEDAPVDVRLGRRALGGAGQERDGALGIAEAVLDEARRVQLEARRAVRIALDLRFFLEQRGQRRGVVVRRDVAHGLGAHGADARVEPHRAFERAARRFDALELPLQEVRPLDVEPRGELRIVEVRVGRVREVVGERLVRRGVGARRRAAQRVLGRAHAAEELGLEPLEGGRVMRRPRQRLLPHLPNDLRIVAAGREQARLLHQELDGRGLVGRRRELVLQVLQHHRQRRPPVLLAPERAVGGRHLGVDLERGLGVRDGARIVGQQDLGDGGQLQLGARQADLVGDHARGLGSRQRGPLGRCFEDGDAREEELRQRLGAQRLEGAPARRRRAGQIGLAPPRGRRGRGGTLADRRRRLRDRAAGRQRRRTRRRDRRRRWAGRDFGRRRARVGRRQIVRRGEQDRAAPAERFGLPGRGGCRCLQDAHLAVHVPRLRAGDRQEALGAGGRQEVVHRGRVERGLQRRIEDVHRRRVERHLQRQGLVLRLRRRVDDVDAVGLRIHRPNGGLEGLAAPLDWLEPLLGDEESAREDLRVRVALRLRPSAPRCHQ